MATNLDAIRARLSKLQNTQKASDSLWKPTVGKHQLRLVPYKFNKENPFIELYFHYNINNKSYLSPSSFGRPDPIVEFSDKLKRTGSKEDFKEAKKMEPKLRTFVPVLVRGHENEGIKFWGFGKTVYQDLLGYFADPDYGDISHPVSGRDIVVEYTAPEGGATYPTTTIRVKPNASKLADDTEKMKALLDSQKDITTLYTELSYDELKKILENWLAGGTSDDATEEKEEETSVTQKTIVNKSAKKVEQSFDFDTPADELPTDSEIGLEEESPAPKAASKVAPKTAPKTPTPPKTQEIADAFDDLFK
jgi:hypothetical protein